MGDSLRRRVVKSGTRFQDKSRCHRRCSEHLLITKTQKRDTISRLQYLLPFRIMARGLRRVMDTAIQFQRQLHCRTIKVQHKRANGGLSHKPPAATASRAEQFPQGLLCFRCLSAQVAGDGYHWLACAPSIHSLCLPLALARRPSPCQKEALTRHSQSLAPPSPAKAGEGIRQVNSLTLACASRLFSPTLACASRLFSPTLACFSGRGSPRQGRGEGLLLSRVRASFFPSRESLLLLRSHPQRLAVVPELAEHGARGPACPRHRVFHQRKQRAGSIQRIGHKR